MPSTRFPINSPFVRRKFDRSFNPIFVYILSIISRCVSRKPAIQSSLIETIQFVVDFLDTFIWNHMLADAEIDLRDVHNQRATIQAVIRYMGKSNADVNVP